MIEGPGVHAARVAGLLCVSTCCVLAVHVQSPDRRESRRRDGVWPGTVRAREKAFTFVIVCAYGDWSRCATLNIVY